MGKYMLKLICFLILTIIITNDLSAQTGFILGEAGTLLKTTDGGTSWILKPAGISLEHKKWYFLNKIIF